MSYCFKVSRWKLRLELGTGGFFVDVGFFVNEGFFVDGGFKEDTIHFELFMISVKDPPLPDGVTGANNCFKAVN